MCLLSLVEFLCSMCWNDVVWFLYSHEVVFFKSNLCFRGAVVLMWDGDLVD